MADLEYSPVLHDHASFLANARAREGFTEAYHALEFEYRVAAQLLKARAGLTHQVPKETRRT